MSALQLWLQNHNRKLTQDAIDEALMEYITHVEKQRDELLAAMIHIQQVACSGSPELGIATNAIASVKEKS